MAVSFPQACVRTWRELFLHGEVSSIRRRDGGAEVSPRAARVVWTGRARRCETLRYARFSRRQRTTAVKNSLVRWL
jgi:hypothetical protein